MSSPRSNIPASQNLRWTARPNMTYMVSDVGRGKLSDFAPAEPYELEPAKFFVCVAPVGRWAQFRLRVKWWFYEIVRFGRKQ